MAGIAEGEENLRELFPSVFREPEQWLLMGNNFASQGHLAMPGHICFWLSKPGRGAEYCYVCGEGAGILLNIV